eukprot:6232017-Alexandrium_andersonii.AAC.1
MSTSATRHGRTCPVRKARACSGCSRGPAGRAQASVGPQAPSRRHQCVSGADGLGRFGAPSNVLGAL